MAASSLAATPYYLWIRRKDGSAGRILFATYTSTPAGANPSLFEVAAGSVTINYTGAAFFPAGTAASPSNLTAGSGSVSGDDTGCTKLQIGSTISSAYNTSIVPFYFDCNEGLVVCTQNPASTGTYPCIAGWLAVDGADSVYAMAYASPALQQFSATTSNNPWTAAGAPAGAPTIAYRVFYGGVSKPFFDAWSPTGWANQTVSATDPMTDTGTTRAWFCPQQLMSNTKGEGLVLKLRQIAHGPATVGAYGIYNATGPVVKARQVCNGTAGSTSAPWLVNFKI